MRQFTHGALPAWLALGAFLPLLASSALAARSGPPPLLGPDPLRIPPKPGPPRLKAPPPPPPLMETMGVREGDALPTAATLDVAQTLGTRFVVLPFDALMAKGSPAAPTPLEDLRRRKMTPVVWVDGALDETTLTAAAKANRAVAGWVVIETDTANAEPTPATYAARLSAVAKSVHAGHPNTRVAALTSGTDLPRLRTLLEEGALNEADALMFVVPAEISPAAWKEFLAQAKALAERFAPRRVTPLWCLVRDSDSDHGASLTRLALFNYGEGVPMTLWEPLGADGKKPWPGLPMELSTMARQVAGLRLKRIRELPGGLHGLVFGTRRSDLSVLWTDSGAADLKVKLPEGDHAVVGARGETLPAVKGPEATLHLTEAPMYVEGRMDILGFGE